jgi:hypothetical protein
VVIVIERFLLKPAVAGDPAQVIEILTALTGGTTRASVYIHRNPEDHRELVLQHHSESREFYDRANRRDDSSRRDFCERFCSSSPHVTVCDCYPVRDARRGNVSYF